MVYIDHGLDWCRNRSGWNRGITRIRPKFLLIIAPVVGAGFDRFSNRKVSVIAVCLVLLITPALAVVAAEQSHHNPLTPPTNRSPNDYPAHMSTGEVAALEFAEVNSESLTSGRYVTSTTDFREIP